MKNQMLRGGLVILSLSALMVACKPAPDHVVTPDPFYEAATPPQISAFDNSLKSMGRVETAVAEVQTSPTTANPDAVVEQIRQALIRANCVVQDDKTIDPIGNKHSILKIGGKGCPVSADYELNYLIGSTSGVGQLSVQFSILDPTLQAANDITSLSLTGQSHYTLVNNGGNLNVLMNGSAVSKAYGKIQLTLTQQLHSATNGTQLTSTGEQDIRAAAPAINVDIRAVIRIIDNVDQSTYFMNGSQISKEEYLSYLKELGMIFSS